MCDGGTGIGGCIRDVIGTGLGAKPIAATDVFCVAPPHLAAPAARRAVAPSGAAPAQVVLAPSSGERVWLRVLRSR